MENSVVEQLRLQEGRLFQNDVVLALFLDVKAVMNEALLILDKKKEVDYESLEKLLSTLSPRGIKDYHLKALHESVKLVAKLLWPTQILLVGRPLVSTLLEGIIKRLKVINITNYFSLDPIKQDYIIRDAFRRTLVNDCLFIFEEEDLKEIEKPVGARSVYKEDESKSDFSEIASQLSAEGSQKPENDLLNQENQDKTVQDIQDSQDDDNKSVQSASTIVSMKSMKSAKSMKSLKSLKSVMPNVKSFIPTIHEDERLAVTEKDSSEHNDINEDKSVFSKVSQVSGTSETSSVQRKPLNVRIIKVEENLN